MRLMMKKPVTLTYEDKNDKVIVKQIIDEDKSKSQST